MQVRCCWIFGSRRALSGSRKPSARLVTTVGGIGDKLADLADAFTTEQGIRIQRQQEHDERMTAMERGIDANQEQVEVIRRRIGVVMWVGVALAIVAGLIVERWYGDCRMPLAVPRHRLALRLGGGRCGRVCNRLGVGRVRHG